MLELGGCGGIVLERRKEPEVLKGQLLERRERLEKRRISFLLGLKKWGFISRVQSRREGIPLV